MPVYRCFFRGADNLVTGDYLTDVRTAVGEAGRGKERASDARRLRAVGMPRLSGYRDVSPGSRELRRTMQVDSIFGTR